MTSSWPWLFEPKSSSLPEVSTAHNKLIENDESLTELDFTESWEAKVVACVFAVDAKAEVRPADNPEGSNIEVDYTKKSVNLPEFVARLHAIEAKIEAVNVRFATLPLEVSYEGFADVLENKGRVVMLSYWADAVRTIKNVYLVMADSEQALLLVSAILRLVYEVNGKSVIRTHKFTIMLSGPVNLVTCTPEQRDEVDNQRNDARKKEEEAFMNTRLDPKAPLEIKEGVKNIKEFKHTLDLPEKNRHYILDEESLGMYLSEFSLKPEVDLRFYKEVSDESIESIFVCNLTGQLEVQQGEVVCIISPSTIKVSECFRELTTLLKKRGIVPKPQDIFTEATKFEAFFTDRTPVAEGSGVTVSRPQLTAGGGYQSQAASSSPAQQEGTWLSNINSGKHLENCDEEMQMMWFAVEPELITVLKDGKVPESSIESSGLDPKSMDHLMKTIESIRDHLFQNSFALALSQLQGCRRVFGDTLLRDVKQLGEVDLMKRIFLLSS